MEEKTMPSNEILFVTSLSLSLPKGKFITLLEKSPLSSEQQKFCYLYFLRHLTLKKIAERFFKNEFYVEAEFEEAVTVLYLFYNQRTSKMNSKLHLYKTIYLFNNLINRKNIV